MARPLRQQVLGIAALLGVVVIAALQYASRATYREQLAASTPGSAGDERHGGRLSSSASWTPADAVALLGRPAPDVQTLDPGGGGRRAAAARDRRQVVQQRRDRRHGRARDRRGPHRRLDNAESGVSSRMAAPAWRGGKRTVSPVLSSPDDAAHAVVTGYPIPGRSGSVVGVLALCGAPRVAGRVFANIPAAT